MKHACIFCLMISVFLFTSIGAAVAQDDIGWDFVYTGDQLPKPSLIPAEPAGYRVPVKPTGDRFMKTSSIPLKPRIRRVWSRRDDNSPDPNAPGGSLDTWLPVRYKCV